MTQITYFDIEANILPWADHAIDREDYCGIQVLWPTLAEAGLARTNQERDYLDVLLMAIGLVDLQGHVLRGTDGHWLCDTGIYECVDEHPDSRLAELAERVGADESDTADEIARTARVGHIKEAMTAFILKSGSRFSLFGEFLIGVGVDLDEIRFENQLAAYSVFDEECTNLNLPSDSSIGASGSIDQRLSIS